MNAVILAKCGGKYLVAEANKPLYVKIGRNYIPVEYTEVDYNSAMATAKQGLVNDGDCNCGGKSESVALGDDGSQASSS